MTNDGNENRSVNLLYHQLRLRVESPLCANLHGVTDGEQLISLLSDKHPSMLFSFKHTLTELHNSTHQQIIVAQTYKLGDKFNYSHICSRVEHSCPLSYSSELYYDSQLSATSVHFIRLSLPLTENRDDICLLL